MQVFINGVASMAMDVAMFSEMKAMAEENKRLKRMYAESQMQNVLIGGIYDKSLVTLFIPSQQRIKI